MTIKIVAAVVLTVAGLLSGRALSSSCERRVTLIHAFREALVPLEAKMLLEKMPLNQALSASQYELFQTMAARMEGEMSASDVWGCVSDKLFAHGGELDCLLESERDAMTRFFDGLGMSGQADQQNLFRRASEELLAIEDEARAKAKEVSKLYTTLGALGGMALAIALL